MARGRKPHVDPPIKFQTSIPQSLAAEVDILLFNPVRGSVRYGSKTELLVALLRAWVDEQKRVLNDPLKPVQTDHFINTSQQ